MTCDTAIIVRDRVGSLSLWSVPELGWVTAGFVGTMAHEAGMAKVTDSGGGYMWAHALADGGTSDNTWIVSHDVDHMAISVLWYLAVEFASICAAGKYRESGDTAACDVRSFEDSCLGDSSVAVVIGVHRWLTVL